MIGNEASKQSIVDLTANCSLYAPASVHWEIGNAFSSMFKSQRLDVKGVDLGLSSAEIVDVIRKGRERQYGS